MSNTFHNRIPFSVGVAVTFALVLAPHGAQAQEKQANVRKDVPAVLHACYVPTTGLVYRIKVEGLPDTCRAETHVVFSWNATPAAEKPATDSLMPLFAPPVVDDDGMAWVGNLGSGSIPIEGAGVRMMWYPGKAAFRVGQVTGTAWNDNKIGFRSFAMGMNTIASSASAMALGSGTRAEGPRAVAIGYLAKATGENAIALGAETMATGWYATAMGFKSKASGVIATALGSLTTASNTASTAMGSNTTASGVSSTAMGVATSATQYAATAMGSGTTASGMTSTSMGNSTTASGATSTSMGNSTTASGDYATAMGAGSTASGNVSTALGTSTASGYYSTALGWGTTASKPYATAVGYQTTASGNVSTALGLGTTAQAFTSVVLGRYNTTAGDSFKWIDTDAVFVIGNGTSSSAPHNAFTVLKNGDTYINGSLVVTGGCTGCSSDERLKQNIQPLTGALERVSRLRGVAYDWRGHVQEAEYYPGPQIGVIGQEVERVFPELVGTDSRGYKYVRYQKLVAPLIEAVKELKVQNEALERRLGLLERRITDGAGRQ